MRAHQFVVEFRQSIYHILQSVGIGSRRERVNNEVYYDLESAIDAVDEIRDELKIRGGVPNIYYIVDKISGEDVEVINPYDPPPKGFFGRK